MVQKKIDMETLREDVKAGLTATQLKEKYNVSTLTSIKSAVHTLMNVDETFYRVPGLFGKGARNLKVGKMGLRIPGKTLEGKKIPIDTEYSIDFQGEDIVLKKMK